MAEKPMGIAGMGLEEMMTGYPAARTWAQMIKQEIIMIKVRLRHLEMMIQETRELAGMPTPVDAENVRLFQEMGAGYARYTPKIREPIEEGAFFTKGELHEAMRMVALARRAMYGYSQLLRQMGLPQEHSAMLRKMEQSISMMLRLVQTLQMMNYIMAAGLGPMGIFYAIVMGGTMAATLAYGSKLSGGGI